MATSFATTFRVGVIRIFPMEISVEFNRTDYADDAMARRPDAERIGPRTVRRILREIGSYDDLMV